MVNVRIMFQRGLIFLTFLLLNMKYQTNVNIHQLL